MQHTARMVLGIAALAAAQAATAQQPTPFPVEGALRCLEWSNPGFVTAAGRTASGAAVFIRYLPNGPRTLCEITGRDLVRRPLAPDERPPNAEDQALSVERRCGSSTPVRDTRERVIAWVGTVRC